MPLENFYLKRRALAAWAFQPRSRQARFPELAALGRKLDSANVGLSEFSPALFPPGDDAADLLPPQMKDFYRHF
ncbi:MAG: hypothetical protein MN733_03845, partial [Nitrososphaera sp.]|nr:hypothetical protein [Nitrososphaera sp.]